MPTPVISVENLSKSYLIGHQGPRERYHSLRDSLAHGAKSLFHKARKLATGQANLRTASIEEFWALKDVSFEVQQGEVLGIIGRNGAGKSTLLKVLSRITEPSSGRVTLHGRVASLLEVGTGFHPELTGRENLYLNGAILGMSRKEITRKFDEIVDFAGVEKFLDTPVKRYSSGMYVRLAFAVAAHLEPEILIVDEVLAVGDAEFQKKCMGKMQDVASEGRTVLFVSHDMAAITTLTTTCIYLIDGKINYKGLTQDCINQYLVKSREKPNLYVTQKKSNLPHIAKIQILFDSNSNMHSSGKDFNIEIKINHPVPQTGLCFSLSINNNKQQKIAHFWIYDPETPIFRENKHTTLICKIPSLNLNVGSYSLNAYLAEPPGGEVFEVLENICSFEVEMIGKQTLFGWRQDAGAFLLDHIWITENQEIKVII